MESNLVLADLADFTGRPDSYYGVFVEVAIQQAEDLLEIATCLTSMPSGALALRLAERAVLSMAEAIYEGQQYRDLRFSPFRSENIGSYSYRLAEDSVLTGIPTGISWFDLAVSRLQVCQEAVSNSSVNAFTRPGDYVAHDGELYLPGPADRDRHPYGIVDVLSEPRDV